MVWLAALNVHVDPHNPGIYERLFKRAVGHAKPVEIRGERLAEIGSIQNYDETSLVGEMWTYIRIDKKQPVVDLKKRRILARAEIEASLAWEEDRGFNQRQIRFGFHVASHTFVYDSSLMSPRQMATVLSELLGAVRKQLELQTVSVTVIQDTAVLDKIYALRLSKLEIRVERPNPDDLSDYEEQFRAQLDENHAKALTRILEAEEGEALQPDPETKQMSAIAAANGHVIGRGYDEEAKRVTTVTTQSAPVLVNIVYDPKSDVPDGFFATASEAVATKVKERLKELKERVAKWARRK